VTPERWNTIRELFDVAHHLDPSARAAFLADRCAGYDDLRREVSRLLTLSDEAGDFLEEPAFRLVPPTHAPSASPDPILSTGDLIGDRFRIVRLLGRGGMAEVYEAEDAVLADRIALKVMRPGLDDPETMVARVRREVQLARRISHPSVCRVHDVAFHRSSDGSSLIVLTMELLPGETLAEQLHRGPLSASEALAIGQQLAEALDAAHAQRILHRDIKPAKIFLVPRENNGDGHEGPRAVLTDFGLARAIEPEASASITRRGTWLGTPEYMAPEQLRGAEPSVRSDLYALGMVLYEMVTARRPSFDDSVAGTLVLAPAPDLDEPWKTTLTRALDPDPQRRFGAARDIIASLHAVPISAGRARWPRLSRALVLIPIIAVTIALVALLAIAFRLYMRGQPRIAAASEILLTDMVNGTTEAALDGATEALNSQLLQSPHFDIVPAARVQAVLRQMQRDPAARLDPELAREVAMREGAPLVVYSTLTRLGSDYLLVVKLERVGTRPVLIRASWTHSFTAAGRPQLLDAIHDAAVWIRTMAGENPSDLADQDRPPSDTSTASWDALRLYAKANATHAAGRLEDALLLFEEALKLDPDFAMARMRLADTLISLKRDREGYDAWRQAIRLTEQRQLTSREDLRIKGQYFEDIGDLQAAEKADRAYVVHYPNDFHAAFFLGSVLDDLGRPVEAVAWLDRASSLRPSSFVAPVHLATVYLELGRIDLAAHEIEKLGAQGAGDWATWLQGLSLFSRNDVTGALSAIEPLRRSADAQWVSRAFTLSASWRAEMGEYRRAASDLDAGIAFDAARGLRDREADKWLHVAEIDRRIGDLAGCAAACARGLRTAPSTRRVMLAGTILARAGRVADAQLLLQRFDEEPDLPRVQFARHRLTGEIRLAQGRVHEALASFEQAAALARHVDGQLGLARALARAGEAPRAEELLGDLVQHPSRGYANPEPELPGMWTDALAEYATLLQARGRPDAPRQWDLYHRIRRSADQR
jgi:tetratricopeptide (TPR) repeat protein